MPPVYVNANQEDVDLLLAWQSETGCHVVKIEAKATSGWTIKQLMSKGQRMLTIFGEHGERQEGVTPHFLLTSRHEPHPSAGWRGVLPAFALPNGTRPTWTKLTMPPQVVIERCTEQGQPTKTGTYWHAKGLWDAPAT